MKKVILALLLGTILFACGSVKVYNSQLKQIELGMTIEQVVSLMGNDFTVVQNNTVNNTVNETIEYVDIYKNHWFFDFQNNSLVKWYKEVEGKQ